MEPEVEGRVSGDNWVKAGSSGIKEGHLVNVYECVFSQADTLNHHILGLSLPLQYKQAKATFKWFWQTWVQAAAFWRNI